MHYIQEFKELSKGMNEWNIFASLEREKRNKYKTCEGVNK